MTMSLTHTSTSTHTINKSNAKGGEKKSYWDIELDQFNGGEGVEGKPHFCSLPLLGLAPKTKALEAIIFFLLCLVCDYESPAN